MTEVRGHPHEPATFTYTETRTWPNGQRVIRSYVAFDSRWPWWKRTLVRTITAILEATDDQPR